ncbi:hypothetical protein H696_01277 [Fonticula alba]|uniref:Methyltransferase domain-containing protein n=1 Tax=Fonticula alba TaxID=691883 RepID=A0A058ZBR2_FONAL|nr:hypothetical protein H696_01277 [Fonticula alba]KCV71865.1 hypothetical protein H696_01277 [Fonticula alba]|eukprot:XP_009493443.1 hypothetical protein H696_01277 [Fonticula alba]
MAESGANSNLYPEDLLPPETREVAASNNPHASKESLRELAYAGVYSAPENESWPQWFDRWRRWTRAAIYDAAIVWFTSEWYRTVLEKLPAKSSVLDVGVGTAAALLNNISIINERQLRIKGVDIDADYIARAQDLIRDKNASGLVNVEHMSIYDYFLPPGGQRFDAVYFSGSFMLLPDPSAALLHVKANLLKEGGLLYFTQTFERRRSFLVETIKPLLRVITTIDFGRATYYDEFARQLSAAGFKITAEEEIGSESGGGGRGNVMLITAAEAESVASSSSSLID